MAEEAVALVPLVGSDSAADLRNERWDALGALDDELDAGLDGKIPDTEFVVDVCGFGASVPLRAVLELVLAVESECRMPVFAHCLSKQFKTWRVVSSHDAADMEDGSEEDDGDCDDGNESAESECDGEGEGWMDEDADRFTRVLVGINLIADAIHDPDSPEIVTANSLQAFLRSVRAASKEYLGASSVKARVTVAEGVAAAERVLEWAHNCEESASVVLEFRGDDGALRSFNGLTLWDAFLSLGMSFSAEAGRFSFDSGVINDDNDAVFVATPRAGKFNAESLARGENCGWAQVKLGFFVPLTRRPHSVATAVLRAAKYVAARVNEVDGATLCASCRLLDEHAEQALDEGEYMRGVERVAAAIRSMGVAPGSLSAAVLFG